MRTSWACVRHLGKVGRVRRLDLQSRRGTVLPHPRGGGLTVDTDSHEAEHGEPYGAHNHPHHSRAPQPCLALLVVVGA